MPLDDKAFDAILSGKSAAAPSADMAGGAITDIIRGAAARYDVDPEVMLSLAQRESGLRPDAKNPQSSAGGLFQFIDGTWKQYGRGDKFDPSANADAAARMLRENLDRFGGNYDAALAAHHVGPGKALQALRDGSIGDVNVSTQKWLADIKGQRQPQDDLRAQKRDSWLAEDNPEYRPDFGGDVRPSAGSRSALQAIGDTGAAILKGAGHFGESMGGLYGLATGDVDPNIAQTGGKALADYAESLKSDFIKNKERLSQQDIDAAEGHINKFATAAWSNMSDPALMVNFFAEQAINFVPGMAAGRLAKGIIAGLGGASAAAIEAAPLAQKAMLMKRLETAGQVGTGVSVATGAVLQGADAGNSAYQQIMERPQTEWDASEEYQRLVPTLGMDGAKKQIALNEARAAFAKSAVASAGLNSFAPAHSIDKILVNGLKNKALTTSGREVVEKAAGQSLSRAAGAGAVKGFLGESASEAIDEGYGQYVANQAEAAVNPNKDVLDDVAQNAGLGAAFGPIGAVTGGIDGAGRRKSAQEVLALATQQAASQPNSPLSRASVAAAPGVAAADQAAQAQAQAADPLAEQVAAIGDRLNDRAIYDTIRNHENLGPQALNDILGSYRVASNFNLDIKQRQAAVERLNQFFQQFDNQPNFTMGSNGQGEQGGALVPSQRGGQPPGPGGQPPGGPNVPTYDMGAPALGYRRQGDTLTDERAAQQAQAEYEAAYADLVKAEQLGASDAELMQKQMAMRHAEARLQEIAQAIDGNRQLGSAAKRDALLGDILAALPPGQNPNRAFDRALRNAGFTDTQFSDAERAKIAQWQQLSDGFMQQEQEPSKPNQLDAAAMGIKEKKEYAAGTPGAKLREVDAMLQAGMVRRGDKMFDQRTGKSVNLSPAQIARAKHVEQQKERGRVMPAYERAIAQRTQQLEQLLANPNHDEREAVRLARSLSGLKQMVAKLQGGASLDDAITSVFGKVDAQAANVLKNPVVRAGSETPPTVLPDRRRITPMDDGRLATWGEELTSMAGDAGWSEIGGRLIRNEDGSMARTRWVPRAEWFMAGMINDPKASEDAVRKALAGEPMTLKEKNHVSAMMDFLDAVHDLSDAGKQALVDGMQAISHDSDFGLPNFADTEGVLIDLESTEWSSVPPDYFDTIEESNNEQGTVAANEAGAAEGSQAATGRAGEGGGNTAQGALPGKGERQELSLTGQTNQEAAAEFRKQQQAEAEAAKANKEPPAKNVVADQVDLFNTQGGLFNSNRDPVKADAPGAQTVTAPEKSEASPFDEKARATEREKFKEQLFADVRAGKVALAEGQQKLAEFDKQTKAMREGAAPAEKTIEQLRDDLKKTESFSEEEQEIIERLQAAVTKDAQDAIDAGDMPVYKITDHVSVAVHPSSQNPGKIQVTRYAKDGIIGDSQYSKLADAILHEGLAYLPRLSQADAEKVVVQSAQAEGEYQKRKDENSPERLVERAEAVAKKYDDAGHPDHGKIIRASLKSRQPTRDNVEFWESSFDRNIAQWATIAKANGAGTNQPVEPRLRTRDDLIETKNEDRAYDMVPDGVVDAVLDKLNGYIKELAAKGLHLDEVDTRFPNDIQVIKRNESGLRGTFNRYAKQLNAIKRGYKRANEDGFAETEANLSEWIGKDVKKLREKEEAKAATESKAPEVSTSQTGVTFEQWKRAVPSLGKVNGWTLFEDKRVGDHYVLMTPYNSVRFDTEQAARDWAKENKAVNGDFNDKLRVEVKNRLEAMTAKQVAETYKAMNLAGDKQGTWELVKALLAEDPQEVLDAMDRISKQPAAVNQENEQKPVADSQTANQPEEEPNFAAAKALIQEAKETHGDKRKEAAVRKKARELAAKTPINHEKTVLALDMISTRLGMGDNGTKPLEFADAEKSEAKPLPNATAPEHVATGASDEDLNAIVEEFNDVHSRMHDGDEKTTHIFDAPAKGEIVRVADTVKVYTKENGWMSLAEAKARIAEWKAHAAAQDGTRANAEKVVLSLFDRTGKWSQPWEDAGYQVYRFDIQNDPDMGDVNNFSTEFFNDWFSDFDGQDIYAILAACPCTDFAASGARHWGAKDEDGRTVSSVRLVHQTLATIEYFRPAVWALENPVGRIEELGGLPPWRASFNPNHFGDHYTKMTLLWGRFNGNMPVAPVEPTEGSKMHQKFGGKSLATKNARSVTPEGFAYSFFMANNAIDNPVLAIANKFDRLDRKLIEQAIEAGVTEEEITNAVEDYYYQDLDDDAANDAIRELIADQGGDDKAQDTSHLVALQTRLSNERKRLADAKTDKEREHREVWVKQIEKEIAAEREFLGMPPEDAAVDALTDDELLAELGDADNDEQLGDVTDYERYVLISADDISKLRKIDVERVLEQGAVKAFRQSFANWIKAKRPDLAGEVDDVMAELSQQKNDAAPKSAPDKAPESYSEIDELKRQRDSLFRKAQVEAQKRHQEEIPNYDKRLTKAGKQRLIQLEQEERRKRQGQIDDIQRKIDRLEGAPAATPAPSSEMDDLKAQMGQAFDELASILGVKKNLTPEEESALLPVMAKIFRIAAKMGMIKFKEAARYVLDALRAHNPDVAEKLSIDNLQSGYVNIAKEIGGNKREALDIDSIEDLYTPDADMVASIEAAEQATNHDATPGQKEAGNYAKGKFAWNGLTISVETAKGEDRTDKETNGEKWRVTMPATYGYIKGTTGADGDQVDVFMGPNPDSGKVYVINQTQVGSEKFDEHKVMLGYQSERAARADYLASFSDGFGRQVYGSLEGPFSVSEFRSMLDEGEFEQKAEIDTGRRLDERMPLSEITVTVEAVEAETGRTVEMDENAADAIKDIDDRMKLARSLLECLAS